MHMHVHVHSHAHVHAHAHAHAHVHVDLIQAEVGEDHDEGECGCEPVGVEAFEARGLGACEQRVGGREDDEHEGDHLP
eukprot:scaffold72403_cov111-Phaeocystis_antarctica.AAC.1